jgi:4-methyl-5(b-hydroxyethyl)-thiazole monophosphate biosynthesis
MKVLVPIAHGSESLETITLANVLRRAEIGVCIASIETSLAVEASRSITLMADALFNEVGEQDYELIVLPGGEAGASHLAACVPLIERLRRQRAAHRWYGAICASPALTLSPHGLLDGKQATCYPAFKDKLLHFVDQPIVQDGHCITSQGPGTAMDYALHLVELLAGAERRRKVAAALLLP